MRRSWNYRARIKYSIWLTIYIYREREREREVLDRMMMMASMPVLAYYSSTTTKVLSA
jgi:predicted membrane-bound mannosyltransferase